MARSTWTGNISFGLVSVAVRMFTATESKEISFNMLDRRDMTPIGFEKVRSDDRTPVAPEHITRGYEFEKGRYVEITDEDIDTLRQELTHSIDIADFVALDEIDPLYFKKGYYLGPQKGAEKPYRLLGKALAETGKVGIAKVVMRNKQHLACLRTLDEVLVLETMYRADEVRRPEQLGIDVGKATLQKAEIEMAKMLVENLTSKFEPEKYDDTYRNELLQLIQAKAAGQPLPEHVEEKAPVIDLMEALRASVERSKRESQTGGRSSGNGKGGAKKKATAGAASGSGGATRAPAKGRTSKAGAGQGSRSGAAAKRQGGGRSEREAS